jgi:hypothetical protein
MSSSLQVGLDCRYHRLERAGARKWTNSGDKCAGSRTTINTDRLTPEAHNTCYSYHISTAVLSEQQCFLYLYGEQCVMRFVRNGN